MLGSQQRLKTESHNILNRQVITIALSANDGKRLQILDEMISYTYGTGTTGGVFKEQAKMEN